MIVNITKTDSSHLIHIPKYQTEGASGFDLHAYLERSVELGPGNIYTFRTGLCFEIPEGFEMQIRPRSGLILNHKILGIFGTIDSDYRGEVKLGLINMGRTNYTIVPGERIAQGVICPVVQVTLNEVNKLAHTTRNTSGFGSTGTK